MQIVDLTPQYEEAWLHCLEPEAQEIRDGVERKRAWYLRMRERGLLVKLALDEDGAVAGMIQGLPIEQTWVVGKRLYLILCIWVHGHKEGIGNRQGSGMGRALLAAFESEAQKRGALGVAAWGMALPFWMKASWFQKQGYTKLDRDGVARLLWKPFSEEAEAPHWDKSRPVTPTLTPGKVTVTCFDAGWCPLQNGNCERARRVAESAGDDVVFQRIDTIEPEACTRWSQSYGIWVDNHQLMTGPPLSEHKIQRAIDKRRSPPWWKKSGT